MLALVFPNNSRMLERIGWWMRIGRDHIGEKIGRGGWMGEGGGSSSTTTTTTNLDLTMPEWSDQRTLAFRFLYLLKIGSETLTGSGARPSRYIREFCFARTLV